MKILFFALFLCMLQPVIATEAFNEQELAALEKLEASAKGVLRYRQVVLGLAEDAAVTMCDRYTEIIGSPNDFSQLSEFSQNRTLARIQGDLRNSVIFAKYLCNEIIECQKQKRVQNLLLIISILKNIYLDAQNKGFHTRKNCQILERQYVDWFFFNEMHMAIQGITLPHSFDRVIAISAVPMQKCYEKLFTLNNKINYNRLKPVV